MSRALQHKNNQGEDRVIIHSDSLSAIQSLSRLIPRDNIDLIISIFRMSKNKIVTPIINWVPSHTGIHGNEEVNREASLGLRKNVSVTGLSATRHSSQKKWNIAL